MKPAKARTPGTLFDLDREEKSVVEVRPAATPVELTADWIARLVACPVFEEQKRLGGRAVPGDETFVRFLGALDRRGGKLTAAALARTLEYPPVRLRGLLAVLQRVLNIDGYPVLNRDDASDLIELDRDLLLKQFDLG